ncbi:M28 family peptidase [Haloferula sp. BvORR071]|uniref:M28 family peptidase n=1 Tax=Haloferula sp. BvORR071 TaxID=1396141 RepID=UPI000551E399|nr:M28 family peptidase [Haloferula sp. BvORR071]
MTEETAPRRDPRIAILLWLLPLGLVVSAGLGIWYYFHRQGIEAQKEQPRFATAVSAEVLKDDMGKFLSFVGERNQGSPKGLDRAAAMIEGALGPANAGYKVEQFRTSAGTWPLLMVTLRGSDASLSALWVVAAYDSRRGSPGMEANASGVTSVMAAAGALSNSRPKRTVKFAFMPHAYDLDAPVMQSLAALDKNLGTCSEVLVVEATGAGEKLLLSSRDAENRALRLATGLGEVVGAENVCMQDDFDLSSSLFEVGAPAVRVSTRPVVKADEADTSPPDPLLHAAATKALVALIEKLSDS